MLLIATMSAGVTVFTDHHGGLIMIGFWLPWLLFQLRQNKRLYPVRTLEDTEIDHRLRRRTKFVQKVPWKKEG